MNREFVSADGAARRNYFILAALWLLVMLPPFYWQATATHSHWEPLQVRKMLDYGFWERHGAMLAPGWYAGWTPDPASHNYVNHPYPIIWLYAFLYWLFGKAGMYVLIAIRSFATVMLTYAFLSRLFTRQIALSVTALLVVSHATIEFGMNTDVIGQGMIMWPAAGLLALRMREQPSRKTAFALGVVVFLIGQINWFALSVGPALMLLCLPPHLSFWSALRKPWAVPGWVALTLGACLSFGVFIGQVLVYSPALSGNAAYLGAQMAIGATVSRRDMLPVLFLRMMLASPALWVGAILATLLFFRTVRNSPFGRVSFFYFLTFVGIMLAIPRLLFLNQHGFSYMLVPCAIIVGVVLQERRGRWLPYLMAVVAIPGLLFCYAKLHDYRNSNASLTLGGWLAQHTPREALVFTNFKHLTPPLHDWDGEFFADVAFVSDRTMLHNVGNQSEFTNAAGQLKESFPAVFFLQELSQPLEATWATKLQQQATNVVPGSLPVSEEDPRYFKLARAWMWSLLGRGAPQYAIASEGGTAVTNSFNVRLYRFPENLSQTLRALD